MVHYHPYQQSTPPAAPPSPFSQQDAIRASTWHWWVTTRTPVMTAKWRETCVRRMLLWIRGHLWLCLDAKNRFFLLCSPVAYVTGYAWMPASLSASQHCITGNLPCSDDWNNQWIWVRVQKDYNLWFLDVPTGHFTIVCSRLDLLALVFTDIEYCFRVGRVISELKIWMAVRGTTETTAGA